MQAQEVVNCDFADISESLKKVLDTLHKGGYENAFDYLEKIFSILSKIGHEIQGLPPLFQCIFNLLREIQKLHQLTTMFDMESFNKICVFVDTLVCKSNDLIAQAHDLTSGKKTIDPEVYVKQFHLLIREFEKMQIEFRHLQIDDHIRYRTMITKKVNILLDLLRSVFPPSFDLNEIHIQFVEQLLMRLSVSGPSLKEVDQFSNRLSDTYPQIESIILSIITRLTNQLKDLDHVITQNGVGHLKDYSITESITLADKFSSLIECLTSIRLIISNKSFDAIKSFQEIVKSAHISLSNCSAICQLSSDFFNEFLQRIEDMKCMSHCNQAIYKILERLMKQIQNACTIHQTQTDMVHPTKLMRIIEQKLRLVLEMVDKENTPYSSQKRYRDDSRLSNYDLLDPKQRRVYRIEKFIRNSMIGEQYIQDHGLDY
jgi:hypothetical protein